LLNDFFHRVVNDTLNPFFLDYGAFRALMHRMEVLGEFHKRQFTKRYDFVKSRRPNAPASAAAAQPHRFTFAQNRSQAAVGLEAVVRRFPLR
jgi:hypothetical protein